MRKFKRIGCLSIVLIIIVLGISGGIWGAKTCGLIRKVPEMERSLPADIGTFYEIKTTSRLYFAQKATETENSVILENYYYYTRKKWLFSEGKLVLSKDTYGVIKIKEPSAPTK